tara:strand:+ start:340 stop:1101 length:762 start_codon:yes stop_codon:yes gene_type:complete
MKWIKHDTDANQDAKLQNVLLDYGLEGYGLYWYCIELIAGKVSKDCITFELEHDARIIARNTGSTPKKVEEIMTYFVDSGLFENSSGMITCMKLAKRLDKSMTSNPEMRNIIESLKLNSHDKVMTQSEKPMQDKIRLEESRREQIREEERKPTPVKLDFSVLQMTDSQSKDVARIRRKNKGTALTQLIINQLAKQFFLAAEKGFSFQDSLIEWEVRGWKSFKAEWMKTDTSGNGQFSHTTMQNIETFRNVELD